MEIFTYALQFEQDGETFYRESAAKLKDKNLADILRFLAAEEHKHYLLIKNLKGHSYERPATIFLSDIANVFSRMKERNDRFLDPKDDVLAVLHKAMKIEDDSIAYYRQTQAKIDDDRAKNLLSVLARQEEAHYSLLSSIIEYYDTPHLWMEQAEFHNVKDY